MAVISVTTTGMSEWHTLDREHAAFVGNVAYPAVVKDHTLQRIHGAVACVRALT